MDDKKIVFQSIGFRPRLKHEYGDGYVLSITLNDVFNPYQVAEILRELQTGYIRITLEK